MILPETSSESEFIGEPAVRGTNRQVLIQYEFCTGKYLIRKLNTVKQLRKDVEYRLFSSRIPPLIEIDESSDSSSSTSDEIRFV